MNTAPLLDDFSDSSLPRRGDVVAGKFRIQRMLGQGGMGVVMAAEHLQLGLPVAIKFLHGDAAQEESAVERFRREARASARVRSDYVPRVFDVGALDSGCRYLVMEYLEGKTLEEEIGERGTIPASEAVWIALQALDALKHAHAAGIVHRDIKPENIFLARQVDGTSRVKVLDFGVSKMVDTLGNPSVTYSTEILGTPLYMPPEQMRNSTSVDHRADIWSFGCVLYEMLTGRPPLQAQSFPELVRKLAAAEIEDLGELRDDIPASLAKTVMSCLRPEPDERIQSVELLAQQLAPNLNDSIAPLSGISLVDTREADEQSPGSLPKSRHWPWLLTAGVMCSLAGGFLLAQQPTDDVAITPVAPTQPPRPVEASAPALDATPADAQDDNRAEVPSLKRPPASAADVAPSPEVEVATAAESPRVPERPAAVPAAPQRKPVKRATPPQAADERPARSQPRDNIELDEYAEFGGRR